MRDARKRRLQDLLAGPPYKGDRAVLITRSGLTHGRISQMLSGGFGERSARQLEESLKLPDRYFDGEAPPMTRGQKIGSLIDELADDALRTTVYAWLRDVLDEVRATGRLPERFAPPQAAIPALEKGSEKQRE